MRTPVRAGGCAIKGGSPAHGKVTSQCMKRHRHQEFIRFLNVIDARVAEKKTVHDDENRVLLATGQMSFITIMDPEPRVFLVPDGLGRFYQRR